MTEKELIQLAMGRMNLAGLDIPVIEAQMRLAIPEVRYEFARRVRRSYRSQWILHTFTLPALSGGSTTFGALLTLPEPLLYEWTETAEFAVPPFEVVKTFDGTVLRYFPAGGHYPVTYPSYWVTGTTLYAKNPVWATPISGALTVVAPRVPLLANIPEQFTEEVVDALIAVVSRNWQAAAAREGVNNGAA